jgi:hypothetical protein
MRKAGITKRDGETVSLGAESRQTPVLMTQLHEMMYRDLRARGISFSIQQEYTADIFVGASITVSSDAVSLGSESERTQLTSRTSSRSSLPKASL